jgi:hypothetical protein
VLFDALTMDNDFAKYLPDEYSASIRTFLMNILNTLTGGEFENALRAVDLEIAKA